MSFGDLFDFTINFSLIIRIADFLIVYFIIYYSLLAIKETRAIQILTGLLIIGLIYVIAMRLGLVMVYEILDKFFKYSVIIVVILFQDDIRRALAHLVKTNTKKEQLAIQTNKTIEEIVKASVSLTKKNLGALIVIEQDIKLNHLIEKSIKLNAQVNAELITSIFSPTSPIHDGAIVIRDNLIIAASVILPLTKQEIDPSLGTRHRAALGLSDESDAIIIIISEEQHEISIAYDRKLIRHLTPTSLKEQLYNLLNK